VTDDEVKDMLLRLAIQICREAGLDFLEFRDAMRAEFSGPPDGCVELIARSFGRLIRGKLDGV
jgi:hypothetical protein